MKDWGKPIRLSKKITEKGKSPDYPEIKERI
jgi:hypothetical protein